MSVGCMVANSLIIFAHILISQFDLVDECRLHGCQQHPLLHPLLPAATDQLNHLQNCNASPQNKMLRRIEDVRLVYRLDHVKALLFLKHACL